jgi:hypothetical protein
VQESRWVIGLDDAVTQPDAIRLVMDMQSARVRVASIGAYSRRFHPKVLYLDSRSTADDALLMIGSANLTSAALEGNSEAVAFLRTENEEDRRSCSNVWRALWRQGHVLGADELRDYERRYKRTKNIRRRLLEASKRRGALPTTSPRLVLGDDVAELDPSHARVCWIECGSITAMGRELEFKAEQGLYFGLPPTGAPPVSFDFRASDGSSVRLRMKYQENSMWRLQMNNGIPEVARGLRPRLASGKLGRSNDVAVFERTSQRNLFDIRFLKLGSPAFARLLEKCERLGTLGRTSARMYGWC